MSRLNDAMYCGVDNVIAAWQSLRQDLPYYSVWKGKRIFYSYNKEDENEGEQLLRDNLSALEAQNNRDILTIKFHPGQEKGFISDKTECIGSFDFRVCEWNPQEYAAANREAMISGNSLVMQELKAINSRLTAIENDTIAEEEIEEPNNSLLSGIGQLMENPVIGNLVNSFLASIMTPKQNSVIAGIPQSEAFTNALNILAKNDDNLEKHIIKLSELSEKKPIVFRVVIAELEEIKL